MESEWARFFSLAGLPDGIAARYASSFATNRVTREMVGDLDKETLIDLGITAVGDQMAILKRVKAVAAMEKAGSAPSKKNTVSAPVRRAPISAPSIDDRFTSLDDRCASVQRRGKPPPDRHEIYHVKMPAGTTARTRKILQKVEALKRSGLHTRGTSGVRKAGMTVLSVAEQREQRERDMEVSSTTGGRIGGLHIDRLGGIRGTGRVIKNRVVGGSSSSSGLFGAAMARVGTGPIVARKKLRVERVEGGQGRLPSVTLQLGNRVRVVGNGPGTIQKQVVVGGRRGLAGRIQGGGVQRGKEAVMVEYEDEEEEELDDGEMYEDVEEEGVEYEDEEEIEYEDEMEDDSSTLIVGPSSSRGSSAVQTRYVPAATQNRQNRTQIVHPNARRGPVVQRSASSIFDRVQFNR